MKITEHISTLLIIVMIGLACVMTCYAYAAHHDNSKIANMQFEVIGKDTDGLVVYDKRTGVEYYKAHDCMTVLVDKDGKPMIYNEE